MIHTKTKPELKLHSLLIFSALALCACGGGGGGTVAGGTGGSGGTGGNQTGGYYDAPGQWQNGGQGNPYLTIDSKGNVSGTIEDLNFLERFPITGSIKVTYISSDTATVAVGLSGTANFTDPDTNKLWVVPLQNGVITYQGGLCTVSFSITEGGRNLSESQYYNLPYIVG